MNAPIGLTQPLAAASHVPSVPAPQTQATPEGVRQQQLAVFGTPVLPAMGAQPRQYAPDAVAYMPSMARQPEPQPQSLNQAKDAPLTAQLLAQGEVLPEDAAQTEQTSPTTLLAKLGQQKEQAVAARVTQMQTAQMAAGTQQAASPIRFQLNQLATANTGIRRDSTGTVSARGAEAYFHASIRLPTKAAATPTPEEGEQDMAVSEVSR